MSLANLSLKKAFMKLFKFLLLSMVYAFFIFVTSVIIMTITMVRNIHSFRISWCNHKVCSLVVLPIQSSALMKKKVWGIISLIDAFGVLAKRLDNIF